MATEFSPIKLARTVELGFDRMRSFRRMRAAFMKQYVGHYFNKQYGMTGQEPINLIFNAISVFVPNLVMKNPVTDITTEILPYKEYAELLGLAVDKLNKEINLKAVLRKWIVDSFFGLSVTKTGIMQSSDLIEFDDILVDNGQVYTAHVDLDDFVVDAHCKSLDESSVYGNRVRIPRRYLLEDPDVDDKVAMNLPSAYTQQDSQDRVEEITKKHMGFQEHIDINDMVNVVEVWVPEAGVTVLMPDPKEYKCKEFLKINEYYGPEEGQYTFLSLTQPVPGNPFPVAPVGIWHDLHEIANRVFRKVMEQADRQKDILLYDPGHADEAQDVLDSKDGDSIAVSDPSKFNALSIGGQNEKNVNVVAQLQTWFNYMSGNPDQMAGLSEADTATQSQINQSNAVVRLSDMQDIIYDRTAAINKKEAFYIHYDPLIQVPLCKRLPGGEDIQVILTPEQVEGDYLDYNFNVKARSMSKLAPMVRTKRIVDFATKVVPSMVQSANVAMRMGVPFNLGKALMQVAEEMEIMDYVGEWMNDPEYMQKIQRMMMLNPPDTGKGGIEGVSQNQGSPNATTPQREKNTFKQQQQETAAEGQSETKNTY